MLIFVRRFKKIRSSFTSGWLFCPIILSKAIIYPSVDQTGNVNKIKKHYNISKIIKVTNTQYQKMETKLYLKYIPGVGIWDSRAQKGVWQERDANDRLLRRAWPGNEICGTRCWNECDWVLGVGCNRSMKYVETGVGMTIGVSVTGQWSMWDQVLECVWLITRSNVTGYWEESGHQANPPRGGSSLPLSTPVVKSSPHVGKPSQLPPTWEECSSNRAILMFSKRFHLKSAYIPNFRSAAGIVNYIWHNFCTFMILDSSPNSLDSLTLKRLKYPQKTKPLKTLKYS